MYLEKLSAEISQGDIFESLPLVLVEDGQEQSKIRRVPAILLTRDCEYDKPSTASVLVAEILLLSNVALGSQGNVHRNRVASAFYLPAHADFPESYVDFRTLSRIAKSIIADEAQCVNRLVSLTEEARLALQRQIAGFFGYDR